MLNERYQDRRVMRGATCARRSSPGDAVLLGTQALVALTSYDEQQAPRSPGSPAPSIFR